MTDALAKKPGSVLRTYTQQVRDHAAGMQRLQDQYFAALKRAEAVYFDGVRRMTEAMNTASAEAAGVAADPMPVGATA